MEKITKLIAEYSQKGHPQYPEDTWDWEREINNKEELFSFMKDIHRRDAYHFNDYPLNGSCDLNGFTFKIEESIILENKEYIGKRIDTEKPPYFDEAKEMYNMFYKRLKSTLPKLRKSYIKKIEEQKELSQLEYLKTKYNK